MIPSKRQVYISLYGSHKNWYSSPLFFLIPLITSPWVIATTHIYQLQMKEAFAAGAS